MQVSCARISTSTSRKPVELLRHTLTGQIPEVAGGRAAREAFWGVLGARVWWMATRGDIAPVSLDKCREFAHTPRHTLVQLTTAFGILRESRRRQCFATCNHQPG